MQKLKRQKVKLSLSPKRISLILKLFLFSFGVFFLRSVWLTLLNPSQDKLNQIRKSQYHQNSNSMSYRGTLFDHRRVPLAISIKAPSLALNPRIFSPSKQQRKKLSKLLHIPEKKIKTLSKKKSYFSWLKRKVSYETAEKVKSLKVKGLYTLLEPSRFYPGQNSAAQLIGLVGTDNIGLLGLEKTLNTELSGTEEKILKLKDARGKSILTNSSLIAPQKPGNHVYLTLDHVIQGITEEALDKKFKESEALSAFAIVADPHTGRILAMASRPSFNPNETENLVLANTKNLASNTSFEPGSVIKPLVIAAALEEGKTSLYELNDCESSGRYRVSRKAFIHDEHPKQHPMTTSDVVVHSSNICTYKIAKKLGKDNLYKTLKKFGIGKELEQINLPGTRKGSIASYESWREIRFANISFGQGLLTTGLEMIRAYSVFANGGFLIEPYLIERVESAEGEVLRGPPGAKETAILSEETVKQMKQTLTRVVTEGTARKAKLENFSSAGKTGTSEKIDPETKSYSADKRLASFIGFAPSSNPHLVAYILIDEPKKKPYYGGVWAAPVFKDIMDKSLKYLNIAPDNAENELKINLSKEVDHQNNESKSKL